MKFNEMVDGNNQEGEEENGYFFKKEIRQPSSWGGSHSLFFQEVGLPFHLLTLA